MSEKIRVNGDTIEFMGEPVATIKTGLRATLRADFVGQIEDPRDEYQRGYDDGYAEGLEDAC